MNTTAAPRTRFFARVIAVAVAALTLAQIVRASVPSVVRLLYPPEPLLCPLPMPAPTYCAPSAHLVVVGVALVVLGAAWLAVDVALRRFGAAVDYALALIAVFTIVSLVAWSAVLRPQPYYSIWTAVFGAPLGAPGG